MIVALAITTPGSGSPTAAAPTETSLGQLQQSVRREGWGPQEAPLRETARRAYTANQLEAAQAWLNLARWAELLGHDEGDFTVHWIQRIQSAGLAHRNMPTRFELTPRSLGARLSPELQEWGAAHPEFLDDFFGSLTPFDYLPRTLAILDEIRRGEPTAFVRFARVALAMALVYDVPPPPEWPHRQVPAAALPRRWPEPLAAFRWWTQQATLGHLYQRLDELGVDELKFVVDAAAPLDDLEWTQQVAAYPIGLLDRAYNMIAYRADRFSAQGAMWPGKSYALPLILGAGGICVDQAFFATQVGKARGVPTLLFEGEGNDARHAWFGYLDGKQRWRLDAGRYKEQRFVTGWARDPQTWMPISDHELKFLSERFRASKAFRRSRVHADFAADYLATREPALATAAAERAVAAEPRHEAAWDLLVTAHEKAGSESKAREAVLRRAMEALAAYPDLEVVYANRLAGSLRARGLVAEADDEQQRIARRYRGDRDDLSIRQAREMLVRAVTTQAVREQVKVFDRVLKDYGRGAGITFFDEIVRGFVGHLLEAGERREAIGAAERARAAMKVAKDSQLDREFRELFEVLAKAR